MCLLKCTTDILTHILLIVMSRGVIYIQPNIMSHNCQILKAFMFFPHSSLGRVDTHQSNLLQLMVAGQNGPLGRIAASVVQTVHACVQDFATTQNHFTERNVKNRRKRRGTATMATVQVSILYKYSEVYYTVAYHGS